VSVVEIDPARLVLEALERERVDYAVFGAVALGIHGLARSTEDLDVFLCPDRDNVERLKRALRSVFSDPSIDEISADDLLGDYPAVQYVPPEGAFHVDVLTRLGEAFRWQDLEILRVPFEGLTVNVVSPRTLYRMKRDTVRAKDRGDAEMLRRRFDLEDE
jgi:Nucleotidyl transferase AbiEii toxin, Type IV TA system